MEETANMLMMLAAIAKEQKWDVAWLTKFRPLLRIWGDYLTASLPDPGNQLCTDDFEGPSPHNVNLAAKGIVGLGAYSLLLDAFGDKDGSVKAWNDAKRFVDNWIQMAFSVDHYKLQYDLGHDTWSLKYNLLFQYVLQMDLFPSHVLNEEEAFYLTKINKYGVPLDNRAIFTKTDWLSWVAAMHPSTDVSARIYRAIYDFANESPSRLAFSDWYKTDSGVVVGFTARPVIGGIYAHMLLHK